MITCLSSCLKKSKYEWDLEFTQCATGMRIDNNGQEQTFDGRLVCNDRPCIAYKNAPFPVEQVGAGIYSLEDAKGTVLHNWIIEPLNVRFNVVGSTLQLVWDNGGIINLCLLVHKFSTRVLLHEGWYGSGELQVPARCGNYVVQYHDCETCLTYWPEKLHYDAHTKRLAWEGPVDVCVTVLCQDECVYVAASHQHPYIELALPSGVYCAQFTTPLVAHNVIISCMFEVEESLPEDVHVIVKDNNLYLKSVVTKPNFHLQLSITDLYQTRSENLWFRNEKFPICVRKNIPSDFATVIAISQPTTGKQLTYVQPGRRLRYFNTSGVFRLMPAVKFLHVLCVGKGGDSTSFASGGGGALSFAKYIPNIGLTEFKTEVNAEYVRVTVGDCVVQANHAQGALPGMRHDMPNVTSYNGGKGWSEPGAGGGSSAGFRNDGQAGGRLGLHEAGLPGLGGSGGSGAAGTAFGGDGGGIGFSLMGFFDSQLENGNGGTGGHPHATAGTFGSGADFGGGRGTCSANSKGGKFLIAVWYEIESL